MCGRAQGVWHTGREYPAHAFDGLGHAVAVAEDGDEAPQVVGRTARVVAGDESPHPGPGPACQVGLDTGDGDHRGAGHPPLATACPRPRTGSWRPAPARRSPGRAWRIEIAIERRVPRRHAGGAPGAPGSSWSPPAATSAGGGVGDPAGFLRGGCLGRSVAPSGGVGGIARRRTPFRCAPGRLAAARSGATLGLEARP